MRHEHQTWEVMLLTPLHIGDGQTLQANLDFIPAKDNSVLVVDIDDLLDQLADNPKAINDIGRMGFGLDNVIKDYKLQPRGYSLKRKSPALAKEVRSFIKDAHNRPYLPGSPLKGALRTALLSELFSQANLSTAGMALRDLKSMMDTMGGRDPNHDFLRALQVSDSPSISSSYLALEEIKYFNLQTEDKAGWKDFSRRRTNDDFRSALGSFVETSGPGTAFIVQMNVDGFLCQEIIREALHFQESSVLKGLDALARTVNRYSQSMIGREKAFFGRYGQNGLPVVRTLEKIEQSVDRCEPGSMVLRLAWGSGWKGMTGDNLDSQTLERARKEGNLGKISCPQCGRDRLRLDYGTYRCNCGWSGSRDQRSLFPIFPKTRRLALSDGIPSLPLGWVKLRPCDSSRFFQPALCPENTTSLSAGGGDPVPSPARTPGTAEEGAGKEAPRTETWKGAMLSWAPNTGTISAAWEGKKAFSKDRALVPEALHKPIFEKRKSSKAMVEVEPVGNGYRIVGILPHTNP